MAVLETHRLILRPLTLDDIDALAAIYAVKQSYPCVVLFIETGLWVDYPAHYLWDRNAALGPLYEAMRSWCREAGYAVIDIFTNMEAETQRGNWDLRVRGLPAPEHTIVDASFDAFFGDDPAFFTNIHPNSHCLGLIAAWETEALKRHFGRRLSGERKSSTKGGSEEIAFL